MSCEKGGRNMENQLVDYPIPHIAINVAKNYIRKKVKICRPHIHNELEMLYVIKGCILCHM